LLTCMNCRCRLSWLSRSKGTVAGFWTVVLQMSHDVRFYFVEILDKFAQKIFIRLNGQF
jgi:hypothetical protein